jgi:hypothetical protein
MRKDKELAVEFRRQGRSYRQIRAELKIPLSTLSDWFRDIDWSKAIAKELAQAAQVSHTERIVRLDRIRGQHLERVYKEAREEAADELESLKYNPLFIAGMMLYWGEGTKSPKIGLKLSNTDPDMMRLYVSFLTEVCRIPVSKIKAQVLVYPDLEERTCRGYWSKKTGIPWINFTKSTLARGRQQTRRLNWGVCIVSVSSTYMKQKMLVWLDLLPHLLMDKAYYENISG